MLARGLPATGAHSSRKTEETHFIKEVCEWKSELVSSRLAAA
jgi:hypothetical protein